MADNGFSMMKREAKLGRLLFRLMILYRWSNAEVHLHDRLNIKIVVLTDLYYRRIDSMLLNHNNGRHVLGFVYHRELISWK